MYLKKRNSKKEESLNYPPKLTQFVEKTMKCNIFIYLSF